MNNDDDELACCQTRRQWLAALAMQALIEREYEAEAIPSIAYKRADIMIAYERAMAKKKKP